MLILAGNLISPALAQNFPINPEDLPPQVKSYLAETFPGQTVVKATRDLEGQWYTYDVYLRDKISIGFNRKLEAVEMHCPTQLPSAALPAEVSNYIKDTYPGRFPVEWKMEESRQTVELDDGMLLEFNKKGRFVKIAD